MSDKIANVKTCVVIREDNMKILNEWSLETGLSRNALLNMLIDDMKKRPHALEINLTIPVQK